MADEGDIQSETVWPMPKFHFEVQWSGGGEGMVSSFQEISGLDVESQVIEYRAGDEKTFSTVKMPGLVKNSNVTLKKGIFAKDNKFFDWYKTIKMNTVPRTTVTISLLNEDHSPTMIWKLFNAWPTKVTGTDLKADGNEVAVETIELAHEGLEIVNG
ncbi:MAG: phage tail-like protein [Phenylobacterium sp.]|jgi:phage tail-like protein